MGCGSFYQFTAGRVSWFVDFNDASYRGGGGVKVMVFPSEFSWDKCFAVVNCLPYESYVYWTVSRLDS
jgi:hypothetical protein